MTQDATPQHTAAEVDAAMKIVRDFSTFLQTGRRLTTPEWVELGSVALVDLLKALNAGGPGVELVPVPRDSLLIVAACLVQAHGRAGSATTGKPVA